MYWRDVITLEAVQHGGDGEGYPAETVEPTQVYADVQSARRSEFYAAKQIGVNLAITVKLRAADYDGQERLVWNGKRYKVERAYTSAREMYELNCSEYREAADNEHKQPDNGGA
ncbi:MAG: phage head closure protein [Lachnospiraceae bacterium]|nr:phage head closure protein [Lachnospiraceae bacterium]